MIYFYVYFQKMAHLSESVNLETCQLFGQISDDENESDHGEPSNQPRTNYILGVCIAIGAIVCGGASVVCTQALGGIIPEFELNTWRFALQPLIIFPITVCKKLPLSIDRKHIPDVAIICFMLNIYNVFMFTSTTYLPLGTFSAINNASILLIIALVTVIISKECAFYTACSVVLCITGTILISQPGFLFNAIYIDRNISHFYHPLCHKSINQTIDNSFTVPNEGIGYVLLAIASCSASILFFKTNKIREEVDAFVICFWVGISGTVVSPLLMFIFEDFFFPTSPVCQLLLFAHGLLTVLTSVGYINALHFINPLLFSLLRSFQVILLCISQYTFMKDINPGKHNLLEITGVLTVFVGIIITPAYELYLQYWK